MRDSPASSVLRHNSPISIYNRLDDGNKEIRLLKIVSVTPNIQIELETVSLNDQPSFDALSYVWGSGGLSATVKINETSVAVTQNLQDALSDVYYQWLTNASCKFRSIETRRLWADAICINQTDDREKNGQLPLMQQIYSGAENVFSWLGKPGREHEYLGSFDQAFDVLGIISNELSAPGATFCQPDASVPSCGKIQYEMTWMSKYPEIFDRETVWRPDAANRIHLLAPPSRVWRDVVALMDQPYWTRVWIFQEIFLAQSRVTFISGKKSLSFQKMRSISEWSDWLLAQPSKPDFMSADIWTDLNIWNGTAIHLFRQISTLGQVEQHMEALASEVKEGREKALQSLRTEHHAILVSTLVRDAFAATDIRDYCWGLLGISKLDLRPDYINASLVQPSIDLLSLWQDACHDQDYQSVRGSYSWNLMDLWFLGFALGDVMSPRLPITVQEGTQRWMPIFYPFQPAKEKDFRPMNSRSDPAPVFGQIFDRSFAKWEINEAGHLESAGVLIDRVSQRGPETQRKLSDDEEFFDLELITWVINYLVAHTEYPTGQHSSIPMQRALLSNEFPASLSESCDGDISLLLGLIFIWRNRTSIPERRKILPRLEDLLGDLQSHFGHELFSSVRQDSGTKEAFTYDYEYQGITHYIWLDFRKIRSNGPAMQIASAAAGGLRIGATERGYLGRFPKQSDLNDEVWLLQGYDRPVILRKVKEHYIFVGSADIVQPLGGRTQEEIDDLKSKVRRVEIF